MQTAAARLVLSVLQKQANRTLTCSFVAVVEAVVITVTDERARDASGVIAPEGVPATTCWFRLVGVVDARALILKQRHLPDYTICSRWAHTITLLTVING